MNKQKENTFDRTNIILCSNKELKKVKAKGKPTTFVSPEAVIEMYVYEGKFYITNFIELKVDKQINDLVKKKIQLQEEKKIKDNFNPEDDMIRDWSDMIFEFDKAEKIIALSPAQLELRTFAKLKLNELLLIKKDRERMNRIQPDNLMSLVINVQELLLENGYSTNFMAFLRDDLYTSIFKNNKVNKLCSAYGDVEIIQISGANKDLITISI